MAIGYDIAGLVTKPKAPLAILPQQEPTAAGELELRRELNRLVRGIYADFRANVLPQLRDDRRVEGTPLTTDAIFGEEAVRQFVQRVQQLSTMASNLVTRLLRLEGKRHTDGFMRVAKRTLGVDLTAVVRESDIEDALRIISQRNALLVKDIGDKAASRLSVIALEAVTTGRAFTKVGEEIAKGFGIDQRRARLIARDQMATLTSELNELRHRQAGISEYVWSSSHDERVRGLHRAIDGRVYQYGKPTDAEGGLAPGRPINCRCAARAVVSFGGVKQMPRKFDSPAVWVMPDENLTPKQRATAERNQREAQRARRQLA